MLRDAIPFTNSKVVRFGFLVALLGLCLICFSGVCPLALVMGFVPAKNQLTQKTDYLCSQSSIYAY